MARRLEIGSECSRGHSIRSEGDLYYPPRGGRMCRGCMSEANDRKKNRTKIVPDEKFCPACRLTKSGNDYRKNNVTADGLYWCCTSCAADRQREKKYRISTEQYESLLVDQNYSCAICQAHQMERSLVVDHDHDTGLVRGLLCNQCNQAIGLLQDSPELLRSAERYLL